MVLNTACLILAIPAVCAACTASADFTHEVPSQRPSVVAFPRPNDGDANSFLQSFMRHDIWEEQANEDKGESHDFGVGIQDHAYVTNASDLAIEGSQYMITSYTDTNCRVPDATNHFVTTKQQGCYKMVNGSLSGYSFRLDCPDDNAEELVQRMYRNLDCTDTPFKKRTIKWKLFHGKCWHQQKIAPALRHNDFPFCKKDIVPLVKGCDCSWVIKKKGCDVEFDDGSNCFTYCCQAEPVSAPETAMTGSNSQMKAISVDVNTNTSSKSDLNASIKQNKTMNTTNHSKVMNTTKHSKAINKTLVDAITNSSSKNELGTYDSSAGQIKVNGQKFTGTAPLPLIPAVPDIVGTCECNWANNFGACSKMQYKSYCQWVCCSLKEDQVTKVAEAQPRTKAEWKACRAQTGSCSVKHKFPNRDFVIRHQPSTQEA